MSQFSHMNDINNLLNMDGELTRGPAPRWQRQKMEASNASINLSLNSSKPKLSISFNQFVSASTLNSVTQKTPNKDRDSGGRKKTPGKSPARSGSTPNKANKTPTGGDRFIPNRTATNFELSHFMIKQGQQQAAAQRDAENEGPAEQEPTERQRILTETVIGADPKTHRILSYQTKAPPAPDSHMNPLRVVYSIKTPSSSKSGSRYIPTSPERILDAPDIINDYYLNLLDWSSDNIVTVALGTSVYLWNAGTGNIEVLFENENGDHTCSLAWIQEGHVLGVGTNSGTVELWDCQTMKRLRVMDGHLARVGALTWNSFVISSGSRDGTIVHHDVRQREHAVASLAGHSMEVCGLKWSTDMRYLASGGNDNLVNVWPAVTGGVHTGTQPVHAFNQHQAAVRALAWCPWQTNVLATGGGTADRCIKFWNVSSGTCLNSVDSKSQVCALLFSKNYKELISAHGYANNQLTIWKYPSMAKQVDLTGHTARVLQMAMSPDGSTVMSAGADETLRLWNCFAPDPMLAKKEKSASRGKPSVFKQSIR